MKRRFWCPIKYNQIFLVKLSDIFSEIECYISAYFIYLLISSNEVGCVEIKINLAILILPIKKLRHIIARDVFIYYSLSIQTPVVKRTSAVQTLSARLRITRSPVHVPSTFKAIPNHSRGVFEPLYFALEVGRLVR